MAALAGAVEGGGELVELEGLGEVVAGADAHGFDGGGDGGEGGHDDDGGVGVEGFDLFDERGAAEAVEAEVEQDDVDLVVAQQAAAFVEAVGGEDGEAEGAGGFGARGADGVVVVEDEEVEGGFFFAGELVPGRGLGARGGGWLGVRRVRRVRLCWGCGWRSEAGLERRRGRPLLWWSTCGPSCLTLSCLG